MIVVTEGGPLEVSRSKAVLMKLTPNRVHKFYTKEAFVAWNVSSWFTLFQVAATQKLWPLISSKVMTSFVLAKSVLKDAKDAAIEAILIGT